MDLGSVALILLGICGVVALTFAIGGFTGSNEHGNDDDELDGPQ